MLFLYNGFSFAQAHLTIVNNSKQTMTVKVMKGISAKASFHEEVKNDAFSIHTVYFSESGRYFTKSKAILNGREPIYRKRESYKVENDATGYSELTLTFTIKETTVPQASGGVEITNQEFKQN